MGFSLVANMKTGTENEERMYTIEQIAADFNVSLKLVRRYVASGQLAAEQRGTKYLIPIRRAI